MVVVYFNSVVNVTTPHWYISGFQDPPLHVTPNNLYVAHVAVMTSIITLGMCTAKNHPTESI